MSIVTTEVGVVERSELRMVYLDSGVRGVAGHSGATGSKHSVAILVTSQPLGDILSMWCMLWPSPGQKRLLAFHITIAQGAPSIHSGLTANPVVPKSPLCFYAPFR